MKSFPDTESILTFSSFEISLSLVRLPLVLALDILLYIVIELFQDFLGHQHYTFLGMIVKSCLLQYLPQSLGIAKGMDFQSRLAE